MVNFESAICPAPGAHSGFSRPPVTGTRRPRLPFGLEDGGTTNSKLFAEWRNCSNPTP
jgi:hypothetical protein